MGRHESVLSVLLKKKCGDIHTNFKRLLRTEIAKQRPDVKLSFEYADLVSRITSLEQKSCRNRNYWKKF